jgi:hypothetical protein
MSCFYPVLYRDLKIIQFSEYFWIGNFPFKMCSLLFLKVEVMKRLFCDCCGDSVIAVYPCKFVFHDGLTSEFNICLDCMETRTLEINLKRKRLVSKILLKVSKNRKKTQTK